MITIPKSSYLVFVRKYVSGEFGSMRLGQAAHTYFKLHRSNQDRAWCDKLYESDGDLATKMLKSRIDYQQ